MGCSREGFDIWLRLKLRSRKDVFTLRFWRRALGSRYFWHDSFGKYWNRLIGCRLLGHRHVRNIADPGDPKEMHCFNCERGVE